MKKILISLFFVFSIISSTNAVDISLIWIVNSWDEHWGNIIFPEAWVIVNTDDFVSDNTSDMQISGDFWLSSLASLEDNTSWWATFDIWTGHGKNKVVLTNNWNNTFTFQGYAWSRGAGWIYFWTWIWSEVIYDRSVWKITWCAWSQNLGWLCFDWLNLDTTPPAELDSTLFDPIAANHAYNFNLPERATIEIDNWNSSAITNNSPANNSFTVDVRKAKNYYIKITDLAWNISTWDIQVVANIPSDNLNPNNIGWWATATSYSVSRNSKVADWNEPHNVSISLRDTYGNIVKPEPWIKNVKVSLRFNNNVDLNQVNNLWLWDAIDYDSLEFLLLMTYIDSDTATSSDWKYSVDIKSFAPTTAWYPYTTSNNNISVNKLDIEVTALPWNSRVWETNPTLDKTSEINWNFAFTPAVKVDNINNSHDWNIVRDEETTFTWSISIEWSESISNLKTTHILDILSSWIERNDMISFQDFSSNSWTLDCQWYNKANDDNTSYSYDKTSTDCDRSLPFSSNIIISNSWIFSLSDVIDYSFKSIPKIVLSGLSKLDTKYNSELSYTISWKNVKYPSYSFDWLNELVNNEVKIAWITNENNDNFSVVEDSSINYIWSLSKAEVYSNIHKNVSDFRRLWIWTYWNIKYFSVQQTITDSYFSSTVDTIIVDWADVIISSDITKESWKVKTIIALKDDSWNGWNIWIKNNVQKVNATLVADNSVLSWDSTSYYNDSWNAKNQLFIKGSVLSYNTIGWSSKAIPSCPYYVSSCNFDIAKRYDFNNFRTYINWVRWNSVNGISWPGYDNAPLIIEYDSDIQLNPPKILQIK